MLKKIKRGMESLSFGSKVFMILILFTIIPLLFIQQTMMRLYERNIINDTFSSTQSVVIANGKAIDRMLTGIEKASQLMINSEFYYDIFSRTDQSTVSDHLNDNRLITSEIGNHFSVHEDVYDAYLYTSQWIFGQSSRAVSSNVNDVERAGWPETAHQYGGAAAWITGYDYGESIQSEYLLSKDEYEYQYLFTMVREMNFQYTRLGSYYKLAGETEKPILIVHVNESSIRNVYKESINYEGSFYALANKDGLVISSDNDRFQIGRSVPEDIFCYYGDSGHVTYTMDEEEYLLCYDTLENEEFMSFAMVSMKELMEKTIVQTRYLQYAFILLLILLSMGVAFFLARTITKPLYTLVQASERVAGGDFSANIPIPKEHDFKVLTESFNHMETEISRLIYEHYEISLREKETQLMALTMQINPHFLYNTLNVINMLAIRNNDEETAELIVSLSEMMQYMFQDQSEKGVLADEIAWISNYLFIMSKRFDGVFQTRMDIEEDLMECRIPKLVLQPIVENSILHGFRNRKSGGLIELVISRQDRYIRIEIRDNGVGMEEEKLRSYIEASNTEGHVGISNVHRRLKLLYDEKYQISIQSVANAGTQITILIPYET